MFALAIVSGLMLGSGQDPGAKPVAKGPKPAVISSDVEGQVTILFLAPEGSRVKKGDMVCELDSAALRDRSLDQELELKRFEAEAENAETERATAEVFVAAEKASIAESVKVAEGNVRLAEIALAEADKASKDAKESKHPAGMKKAGAVKTRAEVALKKAKETAKVLKEVDGPKRVRAFESDLDQAKAVELAAKAALLLAQAREKKLREQIAKCKIKAPIDGMILYSGPDEDRPNAPQIAEGEVVRERQVIAKIVP